MIKRHGADTHALRYRRTVIYVLQFSTNGVADMGRDNLGAFEYQIIAVLARCAGDDYGLKIAERVSEVTRRDVAIGAIYTTLDRLAAKGFVTSSWGKATSERGGRRKRHYRLTASGRRALRIAEETHAAFGFGLPAGA